MPEPPRRVGALQHRSGVGPSLWVCKVCRRQMRYWGDEGVWICDNCEIVAVPTPVDSYRMATTYGRGNKNLEYHFYLGAMSRNKLLVSAENLVSIDVTDLFNSSRIYSDIYICASSAGIHVEKFELGEVRVMEFDNGLINGCLKLIRSVDDKV